VKKFERDFLKFVREKHPEILKDIREAKDLTSENEGNLKKAIEEFKEMFKKEIGVES
jgi:F-type H+-transporting ATPase subunit alpha